VTHIGDRATTDRTGPPAAPDRPASRPADNHLPGDDAAHVLARRASAAMWADDAASRAMGMTLDEVRPGYARMSMRVREDMLNGHAVCHGGYIFSLADSAFAFACNSYNRTTLAQACEIIFVASARAGEVLVAEAVERVRYGRNGIYDVTVRRDGEVVAEFRGRSREVSGTVAPE